LLTTGAGSTRSFAATRRTIPSSARTRPHNRAESRPVAPCRAVLGPQLCSQRSHHPDCSGLLLRRIPTCRRPPIFLSRCHDNILDSKVRNLQQTQSDSTSLVLACPALRKTTPASRPHPNRSQRRREIH
jgi:hypothetical protein